MNATNLSVSGTFPSSFKITQLTSRQVSYIKYKLLASNLDKTNSIFFASIVEDGGNFMYEVLMNLESTGISSKNDCA